MKLSDPQRQILADATQHLQRLAVPPERLPAGARQMVGKALLKAGLVAQVDKTDNDARDCWGIDGTSALLGLTEAGCSAIGVASPDAAGRATGG